MLDADYGNSIHQRRYLGSKTKLLPFIESILKKEQVNFKSFADIFAGTGVVASHFSANADIIINDILDSNNIIYDAFLGKGKIRKKVIEGKLRKYNNLDPTKIKDNYFSKNFSGTYFNKDNSKIIGFIRNDIEKTFKRSELTKREKSYLITSLIYAADKIANTVGHYDAYRKVKNSKRIIYMSNLNIKNNKNSVKIYKEDANDLVKKIKADVVYIDPPYNSRQYSDCYHLLENLATWNKTNVFGVAKKIDRSHIKSRYSSKEAGIAFGELIKNIKAKYILVSYNDMGTSGSARSQSLMSDNEIVSALEAVGKVRIYEQDFKQFTTGKSTNDSLKERIFFCKIDDNKDNHTHYLTDKNTHLPKYVKSPLNYTGGKHKILNQIEKFFPNNIEDFYDVFSGGANVGINAKAKRINCIDKNGEVIKILKLIQKQSFEELNSTLVNIIEKFNLSQSYVNGYRYYQCDSSKGLGSFNKEKYLKLRERYNKDKDLYYLLTLIFYSFNNQIRFNSSGEFNMPVGKRDYNGNSRRNLSNFNYLSNKKKIFFKEGDFRDLFKIKFKINDFIYLDPPYILGVASYNESFGWTEQDEKDLHKLLVFLNKQGVKFALSNVIEHKGLRHNMLDSLCNKEGFKIHKIFHNYNNSNYQSKNKINKTQEVLITNY